MGWGRPPGRIKEEGVWGAGAPHSLIDAKAESPGCLKTAWQTDRFGHSPQSGGSDFALEGSLELPAAYKEMVKLWLRKLTVPFVSEYSDFLIFWVSDM